MKQHKKLCMVDIIISDFYLFLKKGIEELDIYWLTTGKAIHEPKG